MQAQLSKMREDFEKDLAAHAGDPNAHFTPEEKQDFVRKIDKLGGKLEEVISRQSANEAEIERLHSMISDMKEAAALPKRAAYRTIVSKLAVFITTTTCQTLLADGLNQTLSLIFPGHGH
jgi:hypothetical protein